MFTEEHDIHEDKWICRSHKAEPDACLACIIEILEEPSELCIRKKVILGLMVDILQSDCDHVVHVLLEDTRVSAHFTYVLITLTQESDEKFTSLVIEVTHRLLLALGNEEVLGCTVGHMTDLALKLCNYKQCVGMLILLGRLLHDVPLLNDYVLQNNGSLVDYICAGVGYPDSSVQCCVSYVCVQLYSCSTATTVPQAVTKQVITHVLQVLSTTGHSQELLLNILGLLKTMLEWTELADLYMERSGITTAVTLPGALKAVILSRTDVVQLGGVQCIITLLRTTAGETRSLYASLLLEYDIAEFLFEAMSTSNELLIGSLFTCLLQLTETETFFHKCHAIYGMESLIRCIELAHTSGNSELQTDGIKLLSRILANHTGTIRLFNSAVLIKQCLAIISAAVSHHLPQLSAPAADCLAHLIRKGHLTSPLPYSKLVSAVQSVVNKFGEQSVMVCAPPAGLTLTRSEVLDSRDKREHSTVSQQQRSFNTQTWLIKLLTVTQCVLDLCEEIRKDPKLNEQSYTCAENNSHLMTSSQLSERCGGNNTYEEDSQEQNNTSLKDLTCFILGVLDETCLPSFIACIEHISDSAVTSLMYSCLIHLLNISDDHRLVVAQKLLTVKCVSHGLVAKSKFCISAVCQNVDKLVELVLFTLVCNDLQPVEEGEMEEELQQTLREGCTQLHGDLNTTVHILQHSCSEGQFQAVTYCSLYVLYHTVLLNTQQVLPTDKCYQVMCEVITNICSEGGSLKSLQKPAFKYIVYLFTWSREKRKSCEDMERAETLLMTQLALCSDVSHWCTDSTHLLHWCFSRDHIADVCGTQMLDFWSGHSHESSRFLYDFVAENLVAVKLLLVHLTSSCEQALYTRAFHLLTHVLLTARPGGEIMNCLAEHLPDFTYRAFLHKSDQADENDRVTLMCELFCELKMHTLTQPLTSTDAKLLLQVCKLLPTSSVEPQAQIQVCWNLLNIWLLQAKVQQDEQVCCMLLEKQEILWTIEDSVHNSADARPLLSLALVLNQVPQIRLQYEKEPLILCLPIQKLLRPLLVTDKQWETLAVLLFWTCYLQNHKCDATLFKSPPVIHKEFNTKASKRGEKVGSIDKSEPTTQQICSAVPQQNKADAKDDGGENREKSTDRDSSSCEVPSVPERSPRYNSQQTGDTDTYTGFLLLRLTVSEFDALGAGDGVGQLDDTHIANLYICLLQLIIKEHWLYSQLAVVCLDNLLHFVQRNKKIYKQLCHMQWTRIVVRSVCSSNCFSDISATTPVMLNLMATLVKHKMSFAAPYVSALTQCLSVVVDNSLDEVMCLSYRNLLQQLLKSDLDIEPSKRQSLNSILTHLELVPLQYDTLEDFTKTKAAHRLLKHNMEIKTENAEENESNEKEEAYGMGLNDI